jgi:hypothetical protein
MFASAHEILARVESSRLFFQKLYYSECMQTVYCALAKLTVY